MKKQVLWVVPCVLLCASTWALDSDARSAVKLVPAPKEVQLRDGGYQLNRHTRILVQLGHQSEDRIAAETLAEEVADHSGLQLNIIGVKIGRRMNDGVIVLARLDDARVRRFLAAKGLNTNQLGDEGYLLFSDKTHLIVAANSGQGLFSGVQTLRQLLSPAGKGLLCPAVGIRDWPSFDGLGRTPSDMSRGTVPESLEKMRRPQA
jgi:N-acetyl-beta-hexosaminidase